MDLSEALSLGEGPEIGVGTKMEEFGGGDGTEVFEIKGGVVGPALNMVCSVLVLIHTSSAIKF